ncbi:hydroxymethylglutaryl-CoA synthase [Philodulcilactobacillus myokoensis]|uniref:Hydroxymethylglutaryl-CoA synthase n=1 Tax=Philodulcilactobacillus myokoensis TaxID=2929573 RepID=A0A9W6B1Y1_9LACO|nr:hydroxymethylglutaryl-CoA synthase [Philodulcilactobacillus myokoensis]GLB46965.1 hydroxymethylglutaryl-CoA synthase [Philodulcilactobacillus myokoensis]
MTKVGIDQINFYTSNLDIDMVDLAHARNEDPNKYLIGIGQNKQAVIPNTQDAVTLAANAADPLIDDDNRKRIDMVIFGTESGIDNSKSAAMYLQHLLNLKPETRAFEIKQACYGATAGLKMACDYVTLHPSKRVLVIGSDIARYGLHTPGEVTQGGGAIAMVISSDPKVIAFDQNSAFYSKDIMDFWRPLYRSEALVDGHYSNDVYINFFKHTWHQYQKMTGLKINDFKAFTFHLPYTKMGLKGLRAILPKASSIKQQSLLNEFEASRKYNRYVGNLYTGSLYLSLLSLIDHADDLEANDRIGLFSYGSGAQGEFYSGILQPQFKNANRASKIQNNLKHRKQISISQYEKIFNSNQKIKAADIKLDSSDDNAKFILKGIHDQKRVYGTK